MEETMFERHSGVRKIWVSFLVIVIISGIFPLTSCSPEQYNLKTKVTPNEAGTINPNTGKFVAGTSVEVTAVPASGYKFDSWDGDVSGKSPSIYIPMDRDKIAAANFKPLETFMITTSVNPFGSGTITPEKDNYQENTSINLVANPKPGYIFDCWGGDLESTSSSASVIMDKRKNVVANFKKQFVLNTVVSPVNAGTITPADGYQNPGSKVNVTAKPASGYAFDHWGDSVRDIENPRAVTMEGDIKLYARFVPLEVELTEGNRQQIYSISCDGSGYLNFINLSLSPRTNTPIKVNIKAGTIFDPPFLSSRINSMVVTRPESILLNNIETTGKVRLAAACFEMNGSYNIPSNNDVLVLSKTLASEDLLALLNSVDFQNSGIRIQQFAVWTIVSDPPPNGYLKIGSNGSYIGPSKDEISTIRNIFKTAGISIDKYRAIL
jgi:hypothetical protein